MSARLTALRQISPKSIQTQEEKQHSLTSLRRALTPVGLPSPVSRVQNDPLGSVPPKTLPELEALGHLLGRCSKWKHRPQRAAVLDGLRGALTKVYGQQVRSCVTKVRML